MQAYIQRLTPSEPPQGSPTSNRSVQSQDTKIDHPSAEAGKEEHPGSGQDLIKENCCEEIYNAKEDAAETTLKVLASSNWR